MRVAPLLFLVLAVALVGATVGTVFIWIVAGLSVAALGVLFFFMVRRDQFVGPRVLLDDAKERLAGGGDDADGDEVVVIVRREDKNND